MPVIAIFLLVTISSVTLIPPPPHRRDPFRHRRPVTLLSPNPDSPKTLPRPASPSSTASQSASALIPPRTPSPIAPPCTLLSTSERPASHDPSTIWPRTPHHCLMPAAYHIHPSQSPTCTSLTVIPSHSTRGRVHPYWNRRLFHPLLLAHPLKHRTHILRTPNSHDHPHPRVHSSPPLPTHTPDPPSRKKRNNTVRALLGNGGPVTRSHPPPPNPCSPDPPPNPPQTHSNSLKTPRTTPLPQSPGASIAHLRNHDRTPPLARPHPLAMTPTMTRRPTPIPHTQTLILPQHTINTVDKPPTTPSTTPSLVRSINNTATTRRSTPRLPAQSG